MPLLQGVVADHPAIATIGGLVPGPLPVESEVWPLPINWKAAWTETYEFNTDILPSRDQSEQRRALRKNPRVYYEFLSTLLGGDAGQQAKRRLAARQSKSWAIPHGRLWVRTAADIPQGTTAFALDADPAWAAVGEEVVFRRHKGNELGVISTYSSGSGTLAAPARSLIAAGTPVHLGVRARMETKAVLRMATVAAGEVSIPFLAEPGGHYVPAAGSEGETHNGKEVWTRKPNWAQPLSIDFEAFQDIIDFGFGVRDYIDPVDFVSRTLQAEFQLRNSAEIAEVLGFFLRKLGKRTDFYMPAWNTELVPSAISTTEMRVAGMEPARLLGLDPSHRHVALFLKDGTKLLRGISLHAAGDGDSILVFASAIPAISLGDIQYATWLLPTRFFSDKLQVAWVTNTSAVCNVSFLTMRDYL